MSIKTEIDRIITAVTKAHQAVEDMGGSTAAPYLVENLEAAVKSIPKGEDLSAELEAQDALISALEEAVAGKAAGGGTAEPPNIQPLTVTENGTYTASGDVDGYSPIVVNVPTSGGGGSSGEGIKTCTVKFENECVNQGAYIFGYIFVQLINGEMVTSLYTSGQPEVGELALDINASEFTVENVVCGSYCKVEVSGYRYSNPGSAGSAWSNSISGELVEIITPHEQDALCTIYIIDDY